MSTITKDLGAVTAYAYAKEKGYTGTEAEFAELMASYATVAQQAGESAQTASEKAQQASASATSASQSASSASASAQTAQTAQQTATAKASEAQQSATTATTKAQEASQSASTASTKAQEASQSATDAESAKTASETAQASAESARDDAETARDEAQQYAESIDPQKLIGAYPVDTASGSIASFTDGADNIPMESLKVKIEPVQDLSKGDPSPDNICPISGWDSVVVSHSGADTSNPTTKTIPLGQTVYGGTLDVTNGVLTVDRVLDNKTWGELADATVLGSNERRGFSFSMSPKYVAMDAATDLLCNIIGTYNTSFSADTVHMYVANNNYTWLYLPNDTDLSTVIQLSYTIATPITITLSPTEIKSLLGDNNLWADAGESTVIYRADTTMYINRKIAEAVSALS